MGWNQNISLQANAISIDFNSVYKVLRLQFDSGSQLSIGCCHWVVLIAFFLRFLRLNLPPLIRFIANDMLVLPWSLIQWQKKKWLTLQLGYADSESLPQRYYYKIKRELIPVTPHRPFAFLLSGLLQQPDWGLHFLIGGLTFTRVQHRPTGLIPGRFVLLAWSHWLVGRIIKHMQYQSW